jgi:hypothetical protein
MPDWEAIRKQYEAGASKQALAVKYEISRQAIIKRAQKEGWITRLVTSPQGMVTGGVTVPSEEPPKLQNTNLVVLIAQTMVKQIGTKIAAGGLDERSLKLLADSLGTCHKIIVVIKAKSEQVLGRRVSNRREG